jgi:hypothetical protein
MELMVSAFLHKMDDSAWTEEELSPIKDIKITEVTTNFSVLGAVITLISGEKFEIDFKDIDGNRTC